MINLSWICIIVFHIIIISCEIHQIISINYTRNSYFQNDVTYFYLLYSFSIFFSGSKNNEKKMVNLSGTLFYTITVPIHQAIVHRNKWREVCDVCFFICGLIKHLFFFSFVFSYNQYLLPLTLFSKNSDVISR